MKRDNGSPIKLQSGAVLAESIIILPLFFFLLAGIVEYSYAYRARSTLNYASFEAVRAGALHNASLETMKKSLATSMASEYMKGDNTAVGLSKAYVKTKLFQKAIDATKQAGDTVEIISPNKLVFDEFKQKMNVRLVGEKNAKEREVIPNDNLYWRDPATKSVKIQDKNREINLQDANLLKIKTFWCHRLVTPGLDRLVKKTILENIDSDEQKACNGLSTTDGPAGSNNVYLAITSQAIMRMQTPIYEDGQLSDGSAPGAPGDGDPDGDDPDDGIPGDGIPGIDNPFTPGDDDPPCGPGTGMCCMPEQQQGKT